MTAALEDAHEDRLGLCPFRGTVAASAGLAVDHGDANVLFGGIVGGLDVRTVEEHKEVVPIAPARRDVSDYEVSRLRAPLLGSPIVGTDYESWVWRLAVC